MTGDSEQGGHSLWGGRFSAKPAALMQAINASIDFDRRMAAEDLAGSRAHAAMLAKAGFTKLELGLQSVNRDTLKRVKRGGSPGKVADAAKMLQPQDVAGWRTLGNWASKEGFPAQSKQAYDKVLA